MSVNLVKNQRILWIVAGVAIAIILLVVKINQPSGNNPLRGKVAVVYRSVTCGCCENYISYLRRAGVQVEEKITADMSVIKKQFGVPLNLNSCHTTIMDNYVVEGHVPVEAIQKLVNEKPNIVGIALPAMPAGSPGMPGAKVGTFDIASFTTAGVASPYLSL